MTELFAAFLVIAVGVLSLVISRIPWVVFAVFAVFWWCCPIFVILLYSFVLLVWLIFGYDSVMSPLWDILLNTFFRLVSTSVQSLAFSLFCYSWRKIWNFNSIIKCLSDNLSSDKVSPFSSKELLNFSSPNFSPCISFTKIAFIAAIWAANLFNLSIFGVLSNCFDLLEVYENCI